MVGRAARENRRTPGGAGHSAVRFLKGPPFPEEEAPVVWGHIRDGNGAKQGLAEGLTTRLARVDSLWNRPCDGFSLAVTDLGRPMIHWENGAVQSISFSHGGKRLWGGICRRPGLGCDTAMRSDFSDGFPVERVFHPEETESWRNHPSPPQLETALLWSIKEASVKALGTGFHRFDFLDVRIISLEAAASGISSSARIGNAFQARVFSRPVFLDEPGWASLALVLGKEAAPYVKQQLSFGT